LEIWEKIFSMVQRGKIDYMDVMVMTSLMEMKGMISFSVIMVLTS
jgi:hypothetical protein